MLPYNARSAASSGGGILRKTHATTNLPHTSNQTADVRQVELLVFGYACKVFRDDAKAWEIDQGKHLIPWMGDGNLKIDRYDVRGALSDLTPYEPPAGGYGNRLDYLSAEEQRAEQLCEEERYYFLYNNEEDHILQQEEDLKRLTQEVAGGSSYGRVNFQYDAAANSSDGSLQIGPSLVDGQQRNDSPSCDEEPYTMPKGVQVPISIKLPETMKQHAIIEKTARFIASQGVQMEILLKAKQSNNAQFEFLSQHANLNPYYKFVLNAIKHDVYPVAAAETAETNEQTDLKPNNEATAIAKPIITVPTIKYQPSANCAYTQLISKIKGVPLPEVLSEDSNAAAAAAATMSQSQIASGTASPATPILLQYGDNTYVQAADTTRTLQNSNSNSNSNNSQTPQVELIKNSSALALAQGYSSGSASEEEAEAQHELEAPPPEPVLRFPIPTDSLKNIIDKTATYVIKNGRQFEETLKQKDEERFTFLLPENEHYPYYMYKITGDPNAASKEQKTRKAAAVAAALLSKKGLAAGPVSFSIKAKEDAATANLPAALPQEPSDDDEAEAKDADKTSQQQRNVPEHVQKAIKLVESQLLARNAQFAAAANAAATAAVGVVANANQTTRIDFGTSTSKIQMKTSKSEQERNAIFEQQQQTRQKELKKAEEKVKDKLAQIAREKLGGLINKEKQLQLERKRKAMAFLNQIKGTKSDDDNTLLNDSEAANKKDEDGNRSDSSEASVHSIPITSYGPEDEDDEQDVFESDERVVVNRIQSAANRVLAKTAAATATTTTVLLSDDDDIELISESKGISSSRSSLATSTTRHKRDYDERARKRRKYSTESNVTEDSSDTSTSTSTYDSKYAEQRQRRHKSRPSEQERATRSSSSRKPKKSKKSTKSKKKKKHKSSSQKHCERSSSTRNSPQSRQQKHHSHRTTASSSSSEAEDEESPMNGSSRRRNLAVYDLFDRDNITPPPDSPGQRSSSSSSRRRRHHRRHSRHKDSKKDKRHRYER